MKKTAIVLFNLGGPDSLKAVQGFLFNLFNDRAIISFPAPIRYLLAWIISKMRAKTATKIYQLIGGKSPLFEITSSQAEALEKELSYEGDYKVFVSMRYWHPLASEVIKKIKEYNPDEIILLPLYPQFSTTTTASSLKDFTSQMKKQKFFVKLKYICCYPTNPQFINAHLRLIKQMIQKAKAADQDFRILFSAHGLPLGVIERGDPYVFQVTASTNLIVAELEKDLNEKIDYRICYQSKVGPLPWTGPSLEFEINRVAFDKKAVIIVPIAFVSDHSETLFELDMEYRHLAESKGVPLYLRTPALNNDGYFIKSLVDICRNASLNNASCTGGEGGNRICPANFKKCFNNNL